MPKGSFGHYLKVIFYDVPRKNIIFKGKIALRFWCPLFHVFKIINQIKMGGGILETDSFVPFAIKSGREAQDYRIFLILEPRFFPLFRSHEKNPA